METEIAINQLSNQHKGIKINKNLKLFDMILLNDAANKFRFDYRYRLPVLTKYAAM